MACAQADEKKIESAFPFFGLRRIRQNKHLILKLVFIREIFVSKKWHNLHKMTSTKDANSLIFWNNKTPLCSTLVRY